MTRRTFKKFFYVFLDLSGILLGVFLTLLGGWIAAGGRVPVAVGAIVLLPGVAAFFIHAGHLARCSKTVGSDNLLTRNSGLAMFRFP